MLVCRDKKTLCSVKKNQNWRSKLKILIILVHVRSLCENCIAPSSAPHPAAVFTSVCYENYITWPARGFTPAVILDCFSTSKLRTSEGSELRNTWFYSTADTARFTSGCIRDNTTVYMLGQLEYLQVHLLNPEEPLNSVLIGHHFEWNLQRGCSAGNRSGTSLSRVVASGVFTT